MKPFLYLSLLFTFLFPVILKAQSFLIWERSYGGSDFEQPFGSEPTADGGIILGGHSISNNGDITSNYGDYDYWVLKVNAAGNIVWQKSYGGSLYDKCRYATENPDGTTLAFGSVRSNDHDVSGNHSVDENDYWLVKLDQTGNIIWSKCYGGTEEEGGRSVILTHDGAYLLAGYSHSSNWDIFDHLGGYDVWLVKVNPDNGGIIWSKSYGGSKEERVRSIYQCPNGDFVFTGNAASQDHDLTGTDNHGDEDLYVSRIDSAGNVIWAVQYGGPGQDRAYYCTRDVDGNVLAIGKNTANGNDVADNHGKADAWILKLKYEDGSVIWKKSFGGIEDDEGFRIDPAKDGGYIIGATTESSDGDSPGCRGLSDYWFIKVDNDLKIQWTRTDGGPSWDHLNDLVINADGSYTGIGFSSSDTGPKSETTNNHGSFDTWLCKVYYCDTSANINPAGPIILESGKSITLTAPESISYLWNTGETTQTITVNSTNAYNVKMTRKEELCTYTTAPVYILDKSPQVFPNPASDKIMILFNADQPGSASLSVFNSDGKKMMQQNLNFNAGLSVSEINIESLPQGAHVIELKNAAGVLMKEKFVKK